MEFKENPAKFSIDAHQRLKEKKYWLEKLSGELVKCIFPYKRRHTAGRKYHPGVVTFECTGEIFANLMRLSNQSDIRLHIILLAVLVGLINKYTTHTDIVVGAPIKKQETQGKYINTALILRNQLKEDFTFKDMILDLSQTMVEANEHVNYPIETLLYQLNIPYSSSEEEFPLFDVALLLTDIHEKKDIEHLNLNMIFSFSKRDGFIEGQVEYNPLRYDKAVVERIVSHYIRYSEIALAAVNTKLAEIDILEDTEKKQLLYHFNRTTGAGYPEDKLLHHFLEEQVDKVGGKVALMGMTNGGGKENTDNFDQHITYQELNQKAGCMAGVLREKGIKPDTIAALVMERSIEMILTILAVLKAGGAYLPIDPEYPKERIRFMLIDSGARVVVISGNLSGELDALKDCVMEKVFVDEGHSMARSTHQPLLSPDPQPACTLAYIIYTSGTTGKPKGVMVEHRNVVRLLFNDDFLFNFDSEDTWTMFHSYCFDFSVWEMYGALLYGGELLVIPNMVTRDPRRYLEILKQKQVTILNQTPSGFNNLIHEELKSREKSLHLRYIIFGGEALNPRILKEWKARYPGTRFINMYGITETTVHVTYKEITDVEIKMNSSSIGTPIPTLSTYVMDYAQRLLPRGAPGEICIGGDGVARGYLNRPDLTKEKFVKNPFKTGERVYRSGDRGRLLENGEMEYAGRIDNQVKIRAHRIELGELENHLIKFPAVKDAAVVVREDKSGEQQLVAYVVPHHQCCFAVRQFLKLEKKGLLKNYQYYDLPNGMTTFYLNRAETDFMYREIFEKSSYSKYGITIENGACVFDVGANIGMFSLYVSRMGKNAKIFAFEPIPPIFELLNLNTSVFDEGGRIKIFQYGLSNHEGEADFTYYQNATVLSGRFADNTQEKKNVEAFMRNQSTFEQAQDILADQLDELLENRLNSSHFICPLKTISQVINESNIEKIDLLKIDVEKSEIEVLKGINEEDWGKIRQIVLEVHNVDGRLGMIGDMLDKHGYNVVYEQDSELHDTDLYNVYARLTSTTQGSGQWQDEDNLSYDHLKQDSNTWGSSESLIKDIRDFLKEKLPAYMIPAFFVLLEQLPITSHGKVNRKALPEPEAKAGTHYVPPKSNIEKRIAAIWMEVLKLDWVGVNDSFFDIGGTSINIIQVNTRLREVFNRNIPVVKMFEYPTINSFSRFLTHQESNDGKTPQEDEMEQFDLLQEQSLNMMEQTMQIIKGEDDD